MIRTFVFPGQGSQKKGMGENLFELFPEITAKADNILHYSIKELCLEDPQNVLNQTQYTQPALYIVNALMYFKKVEGSSGTPDYMAGHSLGEYRFPKTKSRIGRFCGSAFVEHLQVWRVLADMELD